MNLHKGNKVFLSKERRFQLPFWYAVQVVLDLIDLECVLPGAGKLLDGTSIRKVSKRQKT